MSHDHKRLEKEIVHRGHDAGLVGATIFRGVKRDTTGPNHIHATRILPLPNDVRMAVVVIDAEPCIRGSLDELDDLITEGLVMTHDVNVIKCRRSRG